MRHRNFTVIANKLHAHTHTHMKENKNYEKNTSNVVSTETTYTLK